MALSRIWAAFIIIAISVAAYQSFWGGDKNIFSRMVSGRADDVPDTVYYRFYGRPETAGYGSADAFIQRLRTYGYYVADSIHPPAVIIAEKSMQLPASAIGYKGVKTYNYQSIRSQLVHRADGIIETCKVAVNISISLIGIMALFMGFMSIAERAGGVRLLSRIIGPFFSRLFPELPKNHPAMGHMMMNFSANLLGLDNAATPFGIKAMESLQEINPDKDRASNAQIMFLCLHASGLTLIPVSIIATRFALNAANPTDIFIPCMIATFVATIAAMSIVSVRQRINIFQPVILAWVGGGSAVIALLVLYLTSLSSSALQSFSGVLSNGLILTIFLLIVLGGLYKKLNIFDAFIDGAKGGFETAVRIIPYLVGILVAISMLRTSGTFDAVVNGMNFMTTADKVRIKVP